MRVYGFYKMWIYFQKIYILDDNKKSKLGKPSTGRYRFSLLYRLSFFLEFATKNCTAQGIWAPAAGKPYNPLKPQGWTNFTPCFIPEVQQLFKQFKDPDDAEVR